MRESRRPFRGFCGLNLTADASLPASASQGRALRRAASQAALWPLLESPRPEGKLAGMRFVGWVSADAGLIGLPLGRGPTHLKCMYRLHRPAKLRSGSDCVILVYAQSL